MFFLICVFCWILKRLTYSEINHTVRLTGVWRQDLRGFEILVVRLEDMTTQTNNVQRRGSRVKDRRKSLLLHKGKCSFSSTIKINDPPYKLTLDIPYHSTFSTHLKSSTYSLTLNLTALHSVLHFLLNFHFLSCPLPQLSQHTCGEIK